MAYTADDLAKISKAIVDLANGERVVNFRSSNGKSVTYADADLGMLRELKREISAELALAAGRRSRTRHVTTSKGL